MTRGPVRDRDYINDATAHNGWWRGDLAALERVSGEGFFGRSDLFRLLRTLDEAPPGTAIPLYGQVGIGKTTMLRQAVATVVSPEGVGYVPNADYDVVDAVDPGQVLYLPLEASLYHLERPETALAAVEDVVEYFYSRIAGSGPTYVFLDDVGAVDVAEPSVLLDLFDDDTYVVLAGSLRTHVDVGDHAFDVRDPRPVLPVKFLDFVKKEGEPALKRRLVAAQSDDDGGIRRVREAVAAGDVGAAVERLTALYGAFDREERRRLRERSREYLCTGGLLYDSGGGDARLENELVTSHLQLFLHRDVATAAKIADPTSLYKLCSLAATAEPAEYRYQDLSDRFGVDRRTVDRYLDALGESLVLTESTDVALERPRRTRLYLRDPKHVVLLSQLQAHEGFESWGGGVPATRDAHRFERALARTCAYDHAMRLQYGPLGTPRAVGYHATDAGDVDFVLGDGSVRLPVVFAYPPGEGDPASVAAAFDPGVGVEGESPRAPYTFVVTDALPRSLRREGHLVAGVDGERLCHLPLWLFLLVC
jgi:predicted AAA+ superfamily ATPase